LSRYVCICKADIIIRIELLKEIVLVVLRKNIWNTSDNKLLKTLLVYGVIIPQPIRP
jgi:hypothetical protein